MIFFFHCRCVVVEYDKPADMCLWWVERGSLRGGGGGGALVVVVMVALLPLPSIPR